MSNQNDKREKTGKVIKAIAEVATIVASLSGFVYTYFYSNQSIEE